MNNKIQPEKINGEKTKIAVVVNAKNKAAAKSSPIGEKPKDQTPEAQLEKCEKNLRACEGSVFEMGRSLALIDDKKLYKTAGFETLPEYCQARWDIGGKYGYKLIKAAQCYDTLAAHKAEGTWTLPRNEAQIRPLTTLPDDQWVEAWQKVMDNCGDKSITAALVQDIVHSDDNDAVTTAEDAEAENPDTTDEETVEENFSVETLTEKLERIDDLVTEEITKATKLKTVSVKDYCNLLERIKELITENN